MNWGSLSTLKPERRGGQGRRASRCDGDPAQWSSLLSTRGDGSVGGGRGQPLVGWSCQSSPWKGMGALVTSCRWCSCREGGRALDGLHARQRAAPTRLTYCTSSGPDSNKTPISSSDPGELQAGADLADGGRIQSGCDGRA